jgi:hypothetical protein
VSRRLSILSCGLAVGLSLSASPAAAFYRGTTRSTSRPRDEDGRKGATASLVFADASCRVAEDEPNANVILSRDNQWTCRGADNTLSKTTVSSDTEMGEILDADIEITHAYNVFTAGDDNGVHDLQSVVTHALGHFIGLDHSSDPRATVFAGYSMGSTALRTIEADGVAATCAAYPPGRRAMCAPTPPDGLADVCSGDDGSSSLSGAGRALSPAPRSGTRAAPLLGALSLGRPLRAARSETSQSHP